MSPYYGNGVSIEEMDELYHALGMWADVDLANQIKDHWSWLITTLDNYYGFETKSGDRTDHSRRDWSKCTYHDGDGRLVYLQEIDCEFGVKRYFQVHGASFALIEHQRPGLNSYIPERLFIYPYSPKFSVRDVAESVREYRRSHPARIFLLPTTDSAKKAGE